MNAPMSGVRMQGWVGEHGYVPNQTFADMAVLGRMGTLVVRMAASPEEIDAAQALRWRIFREGSDINGRDVDHFDAFCDHLIVLDSALAGSVASRIVGTYRLMRPENARMCGGYYSQSEFDLAALVRRKPELRILELGRSCVLPQYRTKRTVELLWQGIWSCCRKWQIDMMCGCASFPGVVPAEHALALSFLRHHASAEPEWNVKAHRNLRVNMDLMPAEAVDLRAALAAMPPLIKGYLRIGAMFGEGAVVDHDFGTTDVFVILPVARISERYVAHYGMEADRYT